jgi:hypothetical protein
MGKDGKLLFFLLQYGRITMTGVYSGIVWQSKNLFRYGFDYRGKWYLPRTGGHQT